jgi:hypothetical protein
MRKQQTGLKRPGPEGHDVSIAHFPGLKAGASTLFKFTGIPKIP